MDFFLAKGWTSRLPIIAQSSDSATTSRLDDDVVRRSRHRLN
jgi:hypothetical protein